MHPCIPIVEEKRRQRRYPIRPAEITNLMGTFGKMEVEKSAERIIAFFEDRGYWSEFTLEELAHFFRLRGWDPNMMFFGLLGGWWNDGGVMGWSTPTEIYFVFDEVGTCRVTQAFIDTCAKNVSRNAA